MIRRARRGRTYLVGSPTGVMMSDTTFPTFKAIAQDLGVWDAHKVRTSPYPTVELSTGATIRFRTLDDPEKARGPNLSGVWLDEGSLMEEGAYKICIACLREAGEQGWLSVTATPKGMSHWTYEVFATGRPDTELIHCATSDNPFLPKAFADTLAKQYVGQFAAQELGGLFVQIEGAEFVAEWFGSDIWFADWPHPSEVLLKVIALDPSKGKDARVPQGNAGGDYSAFAILYLARDGTIYVDADLDNRRPSTQIVNDGIALYERHRPDAIAIEINQFQEVLASNMLGEARKHTPPLILPVFGWDNRINKEVRIRRLAPLLAGVDGRVRFKANSRGAALLVQQLRDFRAPPHPAGYHDDGPDAMELGIRQLMHLMQGSKAPHAGSGGPKPMG